MGVGLSFPRCPSFCPVLSCVPTASTMTPAAFTQTCQGRSADRAGSVNPFTMQGGPPSMVSVPVFSQVPVRRRLCPPPPRPGPCRQRGHGDHRRRLYLHLLRQSSHTPLPSKAMKK